jgi:MFS family permease
VRSSHRRPVLDARAGVVAAVLFAVGLGLASVALPLLALEVGYSGPQVGLLVALSALAQMTSRLFMGAWMRRLPDKTFVVAAALLLMLSNAVPVLTTALVPFALAHMAQGVARAFFWTGSQTHVVRGDAPAVRGLARINLASAAGLLVGPVLAGWIGERSLTDALLLGAVLGLAACVPAAMLDRLPPFVTPTDRVPGRIWRRPGVDAGCWAGVAGGAWRGLLGSFVPVALQGARNSSTTIGILVSVANVAQLVASGAVGRLRTRSMVPAFAAGALMCGAGTAVIGFVAGEPVLAGIALAVSGLGAGMLQTVGPAVATEAVDPQERGDVIAATGTFRAAALLVAPLGAAAVATVAPVSLALVLGGLVAGAPVLFVRRLHQHVRRPDEGEP